MKIPRIIGALALCVSLSFGATGCGANGPDSSASLDEATMALLSAARALHSEADMYENNHDYAQATQAIERVLALRAPTAVREVQDVRVDASGRLAELALRSDDPDAALARVDVGLREAQRDSVLKARLYLVRGRALRLLSERAHTAADLPLETRRRNEAIEALEQSIRMNEHVLAVALDGGI